MTLMPAFQAGQERQLDDSAVMVDNDKGCNFEQQVRVLCGSAKGHGKLIPCVAILVEGGGKWIRGRVGIGRSLGLNPLVLRTQMKSPQARRTPSLQPCANPMPYPHSSSAN